MKAALKGGQKDRVAVLRLLINEFQQEQMRLSRDELDEAEELGVLAKAVKARNDAVAQAKELGRDDVVATEAAEIVVIQEYLPAPLEGEELAGKVRELAAELGCEGPKDKGRFMKEFMARYKGRAEGKAVQAALGEVLG